MKGEYDAEKIAEKVRNTQINNAKKEGIKEGIEQGSNQRNIEIVKNMLNKNIDITIKSDVTGLSVQEIKSLNKK